MMQRVQNPVGRPQRRRRVGCYPHVTLFKPAGVPQRLLEVLTITVDELEALRLADLEGLYHLEAAQRMEVSRQTFGRIITSAHRKVARALVEGQAITIEGGVFVSEDKHQFVCGSCRHTWSEPDRSEPPATCPKCWSNNIYRLRTARNRFGRGAGRRKGRMQPLIDKETA